MFGDFIHLICKPTVSSQSNATWPNGQTYLKAPSHPDKLSKMAGPMDVKGWKIKTLEGKDLTNQRLELANQTWGEMGPLWMAENTWVIGVKEPTYRCHLYRCWFQIVFLFSPRDLWKMNPFWKICFKGVETTWNHQLAYFLWHRFCWPKDLYWSWSKLLLGTNKNTVVKVLDRLLKKH